MRLTYLSVVRIDLQFASEELARAMAGPTTGRCGNTEEMHPFLVEVSTVHPEL